MGLRTVTDKFCSHIASLYFLDFAADVLKETDVDSTCVRQGRSGLLASRSLWGFNERTSKRTGL